MWEQFYIKRLKRDLPRWIERGWIDPRHRDALLEDAADSGGVNYAPIAFALMGVILFGTGVILFISANWQEMSRITKLGLLFGALWAAYGGAAYVRARHGAAARGFTGALMLLGIILFGANIMLIAQIYHIDSHYPDGVLLWSLGALAAVFLVPGQVAAVAGLGLAVTWSFLELFDFSWLVHWPFLIVWGLFMSAILRHRWRVALWIAMAALLIWEGGVLVSWADYDEDGAVFLVQALVLFNGLQFAAGRAMNRHPFLAPLGGLVERFALLGALGGLYILSLRVVHGLETYGGTNIVTVAPPMWMGITVALGAACAGAVAWLARHGETRGVRYAGPMVALVVVALGARLVAGSAAMVEAICILQNITFFVVVLWTIHVGYRIHDRFTVNLAFLFFAIGVLTLYFERFWTLMDRALFFMGGGALLFVGGYLLERQRRRLTRAMVDDAEDGP